MPIQFKPVIPRNDLDQMKNFGIVLCGGGAAGRWQAGVLSALQQAGVLAQAKVIIGTSVGGLNTGVFGLHNKPGDMVGAQLWDGITKNEHIYKGSMDNIFGKIGAFFGVGLGGAESVFDPQPLYDTLKKTFGDLTISQIAEKSGTQIIVSNQDLNDQIEEFYRSFDTTGEVSVVEALKMTSAIPVAFKSVKRQDSTDKFPHWHVDGGVGANNPFIAIDLYNNTFVGSQVKKMIVVYCYPDAVVDTGVSFSDGDNHEYRTALQVGLRTIPSMLNSQEQQVEANVQRMVANEGWEVMAFWPDKTPCDSLDFTKTSILQDGYDHAVAGLGYDYKSKAKINIVDFLKK